MAVKTHPIQTQGTGNEYLFDKYAVGQPVGNIFWVCSAASAAGDTDGKGFNPEAPFSSIDYAVGKCNADSNDLILVLPGHVETITAAGGLALDVAGITIRGLGVGRQRPRINYTTAIGASMNVTAARVTVENLYFTMTGFDAITAGINVSAADFTLQDCEIVHADATNQAVLALLTASGADRMRVLRNFIHGSADAGTAAAIRIAAGTDIQIEDNLITGNYTTTLGGIDNSAAVAGLQIHNNRIANNTASAAKAFVAHGSTTGQFSRNVMAVLTGTAPVTAAAMNNLGGGYYSAAAGVAAGTLI